MIDKLLNGETIIYKAKGTSMSPVIRSMQPVRVEPVELLNCKVGDIVLCKVHGRVYLHFIKAMNEKHGVQIGNNRGHINGWTRTVYGKVTKIG